jgi:hypothetical protein
MVKLRFEDLGEQLVWEDHCARVREFMKAPICTGRTGKLLQ